MDAPSRRPIFPWQVPHACAEDRAMGLELELIELVRSRSLARDRGRSVEPFDRDIDQVLGGVGRPRRRGRHGDGCVLSAAGLAGRLIELAARLLVQFDDQLNDVWEPFLIDDDVVVPAALRP